MNSKSFLLFALAFLGASATPLVSTTVNGVGPTVSETVITPFHRTDSVSTPCGKSVTTTLPVVPYGVATGTGFLGNGAGVYQGTGVGVYPGVVGGFARTGGVYYPGVVAGGLAGTGAVYQGLGGVRTGVVGTGIVSGGLGVYPCGNVIV